MNGNTDFQSEDFQEKVLSLFRSGQVGLCVNAVAHDLNNVLGAITAYSDLMSLDASLSEESAQWVSKISEATEKCSTMVSTLTAIARPAHPDTSVIEVREFAERVIDIRLYSFRTAKVSLETEFEPGVSSLVADLPQVELAILYLLANALEAAEGGADARVRMSVRNDADMVAFEFWDSGPGIAEGERETIFEAFYTTKGGDHLGLGLLFARQVARRHGGDLVFDEDKGFVLRLARMGNAQEGEV